MHLCTPAAATRIRFVLGDVRDTQRLNSAMQHMDYVFHLAAMKHVSSCEQHPLEAVQTNITGSYNVMEAALRNRVRKVIFSSSDKAVHPVNTYGATKIIAERLFASHTAHNGMQQTLFTSVRFGNILGSRGSVIPRFISQIRQQQNLDITEPDAVRFIMSRQQAASLLLQACELASGGEVFIYKMPAIRLADLVQMLIEETCLLYNQIYTGCRQIIGLMPGERAYEQLISEEEAPHTWETNDMFIYSAGRRPRIPANGRYCRPARLQHYRSVAGDPEDEARIRLWIRQYLEQEHSPEPEAALLSL